MSAFYFRYIENCHVYWDIVEADSEAEAVRILNETYPIPPEPLQIVCCYEFPSVPCALRYHDETYR